VVQRANIPVLPIPAQEPQFSYLIIRPREVSIVCIELYSSGSHIAKSYDCHFGISQGKITNECGWLNTRWHDNIQILAQEIGHAAMCVMEW